MKLGQFIKAIVRIAPHVIAAVPVVIDVVKPIVKKVKGRKP